ncbi:hypothetical protein ACHAXH_005526 [Discostella pseudostelligera]
MNPASSSSDDNDDDSSSSSSSSTPSEEGAIRTKPLHRRSGNQQSAHSDGDEQEYGDVASSSDEEDGSDDDSEELDDDGVRRNVTNFEDLPTDDSEDDSSDGDSDGDDQSDSDDSHVKKQHSKISRSDDSSEDDMSEDNEDEEKINQEDIPLSERMASRAGLGRRYYTGDGTSYDHGGKQQKAERKHRAIDLASERLREARKGQRKDRHSKQSTSDAEDDHDNDDSSIEQFFSNNNKDNPTTTKVKKSKHAPTEMSSKRQDYFSRGRPDLNSSGIGVSIGANKYKARDPRMISLSGHLDADAFERRYGFLDEIQEKEIELLKSRVKAWKTSGKKGQKARRKLGLTSSGNATSLEADQEELTRLLQERAERQRANVVRAAKRTVKSKLRSEVASGKRGAYYPKRSELKKMEAEAKFDEIRKRGGNEAVDAAIAKRRKKNVAKEARSMPSHMIS